MHQTLSVSLCFFYIYYDLYLIVCSADPLENRMKYKYLLLLVVLSDAKIGSTLGRDLALSSLGRRHHYYICSEFRQTKFSFLKKNQDIF